VELIESASQAVPRQRAGAFVDVAIEQRADADPERRDQAPSPAATAALIALTQADTVLLWDPADRTLIAANLVGRMPWTEADQPTGDGKQSSDAGCPAR